MRHLSTLSKSRRFASGSAHRNPAPAISLLEKQAIADLLERDLSQIAVFLNIIAGLKSQTA